MWVAEGAALTLIGRRTRRRAGREGWAFNQPPAALRFPTFTHPGKRVRPGQSPRKAFIHTTYAMTTPFLPAAPGFYPFIHFGTHHSIPGRAPLITWKGGGFQHQAARSG